MFTNYLLCFLTAALSFNATAQLDSAANRAFNGCLQNIQARVDLPYQSRDGEDVYIQFKRSSGSDGDCSDYSEYHVEKAFWGPTDDYFDDVELTSIEGRTYNYVVSLTLKYNKESDRVTVTEYNRAGGPSGTGGYDVVGELVLRDGQYTLTFNSRRIVILDRYNSQLIFSK